MKELVSDQAPRGRTDNADYGGMSRDGEKVFFTLAGHVYERSGGVTRLVDRAADGSPSAFASEYAGSTPDGSHVYFTTGGRLTPEDTDNRLDLYQRAGGVTTLISTGPVADQGQFPGFAEVSDDGSRVFFATRAPLVPEDTDFSCDIGFPSEEPGCADIYERSAGTTKLVSTGPTEASASFEAVFLDMSADGTKVFFATEEAVVAGDTDTTTDAFERSGSTTRLVTTGPADDGTEAYLTSLPYLQASRDGERVFFESFAQLTADDDDQASDVYGRFGGTTTVLVSAGGLGQSNQFVAGNSGGISNDGSRVYFSSHDQLTPDDDDLYSDVYEWNEGDLTRHSTGTGRHPQRRSACLLQRGIGRRLARVLPDGTAVGRRRYRFVDGYLRALRRRHDAGLHRPRRSWRRLP